MPDAYIRTPVNPSLTHLLVLIARSMSSTYVFSTRVQTFFLRKNLKNPKSFSRTDQRKSVNNMYMRIASVFHYFMTSYWKSDQRKTGFQRTNCSIGLTGIMYLSNN